MNLWNRCLGAASRLCEGRRVGAVVCVVHSNVLSIVCVGNDAGLAEACVIAGFVLLDRVVMKAEVLDELGEVNAWWWWVASSKVCCVKFTTNLMLML